MKRVRIFFAAMAAAVLLFTSGLPAMAAFDRGALDAAALGVDDLEWVRPAGPLAYDAEATLLPGDAVIPTHLALFGQNPATLT